MRLVERLMRKSYCVPAAVLTFASLGQAASNFLGLGLFCSAGGGFWPDSSVTSSGRDSSYPGVKLPPPSCASPTLSYGLEIGSSREGVDGYDVGHVIDRRKVERRVAGEQGGDAECAALAGINVELSDEFT
jgi:hypothetical protein